MSRFHVERVHSKRELKTLAMSGTPQLSRLEMGWILGLTLLAALIRLIHYGSLGIDHFDEGIYAQAGFWVYQPGGIRDLSPSLIPYAPPGFPILIGLLYALIGPSDLAPILVSTVAGVLTVPAVGWFGRRAFGPGAGLGAAALAALSGPHILASRVALTDALLLLFWILALGFGLKFLEQPKVSRAVLFGFLVGLAQLVKYSGWLTGLIVVVTLLSGLRTNRHQINGWLRTLGLGILGAIVAGLVYLPWFLYVEEQTGYRSLMAHHASYVDGPSAWWRNWSRQMSQSIALEGPLFGPVRWSSLSLGLAWVAAACVVVGRMSAIQLRFSLKSLLLVLGPGVGLSLTAPTDLAWWIALGWVPFLLVSKEPSARLTGIWWLLMAVITPLYHPYPRLWLPALASSWVLGGGLLTILARGLGQFLFKIVNEPEDSGVGGKRIRTCLVALLLGVFSAVFIPWAWPVVKPFPNLFVRSDGLETMVDQLDLGTGPRRSITPVAIKGRPSVLFYLGKAGLPYRVYDELSPMFVPMAPGATNIIDPAQGNTRAEVARVIDDSSGWILSAELTVPLSLSTLLNVSPDVIYDPNLRRLSSDQTKNSETENDRQIPEDWAGSCTFLIYRNE